MQYIAVTLVADQGAICRLQSKAPLLVDTVVAGETVVEHGLIAGRVQQAKMEQCGNLERWFATIHCIQQPEEQIENFRIPILFSGESNDQFTCQNCCYIASIDGAQGEKRVFQFCLAEKEKSPVPGWTVGDPEQSKQFEFVDKTLF